MKTQIITILFLTILMGCGGVHSPVSPVPLHGNAVGNGGGVIVCAGKQPVLLDVWELSELQHGKVTLPEGSYLDKAVHAVTRISKWDDSRVQQYSERIKQFDSETVFLKGVELTYIPDALNVALPKECELKQLAVQQKQVTKTDPKYVVNKDLWDLLDADNQAALVLHEIIYREAIESRNHSDSKLVRKFNGYLLAETAFKGFDSESYRKLLGDLKLPYWVGGVPVKPQTVVMENGRPVSGESVELDTWIKVGSNQIFLGRNRATKFYPSGKLLRAIAGWTVETGEKAMITIGHTSVEFDNEGFADFYEDGSVKAITLGPGVLFPVQGLTPLFYSTSENDVTEFYLSGNIKTGTLASAATLRMKDGTEKLYCEKTRLSFDEEGYVIAVIK